MAASLLAKRNFIWFEVPLEPVQPISGSRVLRELGAYSNIQLSELVMPDCMAFLAGT